MFYLILSAADPTSIPSLLAAAALVSAVLAGCFIGVAWLMTFLEALEQEYVGDSWQAKGLQFCRAFVVIFIVLSALAILGRLDQ